MYIRKTGFKISRQTLNTITSFIIQPLVWVCGMPGWKRQKKDHTNIHRMPYSYSSPPSENLSTIRFNVAKLTPMYFLFKLLRALLDARRNSALSLLPKILDGHSVHVVDVGAAEGVHPRWEALGSNLKLSLFEPDSEAYSRLIEEYQGDQRVECFKLGLAENPGDLTLHICEWPRGSSIFRPNQKFMERTRIPDHYKVAASVSIPAESLIDVLPDADISIIKADVEGYELPILRGAGHLLDKCICLELEVNFNPFLRDDVPLFSSVELFCREQGFSLVTLSVHEPLHYLMPSSEYESRGFITSGDALFFRMPHTIGELVLSGVWPKSRLALACCSYLVYGNFELAYELMRLAVQEALLGENDEIYLGVMECVRLYAGYDRLVSYRKIKSLMHWVQGSSESDSIDY